MPKDEYPIKNVELPPAKTALVVVDMQYAGFKTHGPSLKTIVPNLKGLLERARKANVKIIHVQSVRSPLDPEIRLFKNKTSLLEGTRDVEIIDELKPLKHEPVVRKHSHDCFFRTDMEAVLARYDVRSCEDNVIVTGIGSNNCVYHAVLGFHLRSYYVYVPIDCIHASTPKGQDFALYQWSNPCYRWNVTLTDSKRLQFLNNP